MQVSSVVIFDFEIHINQVRSKAKVNDQRRLDIHPNKGDHISLHVVICDTGSDSKGWDACVDVSFFVYDHIQNNYVTFQDVNGHRTRFNEKTTAWGFDKLISTESFMESKNGYLFYDSCVFGVEIIEVPQFTRLDRCLLMTKPLPTMNTFTWTIKNFSTLTEEALFSDAFKIGKVKWKLLLYPKGNMSGEGTHLSIYLGVHDVASFPDGWKLYAKFNLRVKNQCSKVIKRKLQLSTKLMTNVERLSLILMYLVICSALVTICMYYQPFRFSLIAGLPILPIVFASTTCLPLRSAARLPSHRRSSSSSFRSAAPHFREFVFVEIRVRWFMGVIWFKADMFISRRKREPAHYMLKIESFSILYEAKKSKIESDVFDASGHKWRLDIHPNKGDHISLHVVICDTGSDSKGWDVCVDVSFFVYDHIQNNYVTFQGQGLMRRRQHGVLKTNIDGVIYGKNLSLFSKGYGLGIGTHLSIFLGVHDAMSLPNGWKVFADFKIQIKSPFTESDIVQGFNIWFCNSDNKGFQTFMLLSELINGKNGFLLNDSLSVEVEFLGIGKLRNFI
ncbi:hypothetical protein R6Q59_022799 [Mikania micrantha]